MRVRALALMLASLAMLGVAGAAPAKPAAAAGIKPESAADRSVLFVGNSLTYLNDLPGMIQRLVKAGKEEQALTVGREAGDGFTLQRHWRTGRFQKALAEKSWEVVILQEQSEIPSFSKDQRAQMLVPFAQKMHKQIKTAGGRTALFLTWGWREGDRPNNRTDTYEAMQKRLRAGYLDLAEKLLVPIIPVGDAWERANRERPALELWSSEQQPSLAGSYLAACVVYGWLYEKSPVGNSYTAGLPRDDARFLQVMAAATLHDWFQTPLGAAPSVDSAKVVSPKPTPDSSQASPKPALVSSKPSPKRPKDKTGGSARTGEVKKEGAGLGPAPLPDGPRVIVPPRRWRGK